MNNTDYGGLQYLLFRFLMDDIAMINIVLSVFKARK